MDNNGIYKAIMLLAETADYVLPTPQFLRGHERVTYDQVWVGEFIDVWRCEMEALVVLYLIWTFCG